MTNQQMYSELFQKYLVLGQEIDHMVDQRTELANQMEKIATAFPDTFYYRIDTHILYRDVKNKSIQLREFTK